MPSQPPALFSEALLVEMEEIGIQGPLLKKQGLLLCTSHPSLKPVGIVSGDFWQSKGILKKAKPAPLHVRALFT